MPFLQVERRDSVAVIWMDQPGEKVNKISPDMLDELAIYPDATTCGTRGGARDGK